MYSHLDTVAVSRTVMFQQTRVYSNLATVAVSYRSVMLEQTRHV